MKKLIYYLLIFLFALYWHSNFDPCWENVINSVVANLYIYLFDLLYQEWSDQY